MRYRVCAKLLATVSLVATLHAASAQSLKTGPNDTLETQGLSVIIDQNQFSPIFFDEKNAGIQLVLHGDRIATDGAVRLDRTPEQWAPVPAFISRERGSEPNQIVVRSAYKDQNLAYRVKVTAEGTGFRIAVDLDQPLPHALAGKAGFNLDFLPTAYFGKTYLMDAAPGLFPRHPTGEMALDGSGDPLPLATGGTSITLAPEDPLTRVSITSDAGTLSLYDARARAQNGWFVVRSLIAEGAKENAVVWHVRPNVIKGWTRAPVVSFNQAGYTPARDKVALIELDPAFKAPGEAELVKLAPDGSRQVVLRAKTQPRGRFLRYDYAAFDFSSVRDPGIYAITYAGNTTNPFRISPDVYDHVWQTSLDTFLAEQMDHVGVREQYRVWQSPSHLDDARQAPVNHVHFDGYRMGPNLDSPFKAGEHIPGLAVGGWQDAGDYDIQTPDNAWVVRDLVWAHELFGLKWDQTSVDEAARAVEIRKPDGIEDSLQQIRHGTLQLLAQYKVFGHAIVGIIDPTLRQYAHLGDAGSQTDGKLYDPKLGPLGDTGATSGKPDDRWAFTTDIPATNLYVVGALAGASRALATLDPKMSAEALATAKALWAKQQPRLVDSNDGRENSFASRFPDVANVAATVELVITTKGDPTYTAKLKALLPTISERFAFIGSAAVRAIPFMDADYRAKLVPLVQAAKAKIDTDMAKNPFGVPVSLGTWAGSHDVATFGSTMYMLHTAFPEIVGPEYSLRALDYMLGRHPANNLSLVSTVGTQSRLIGYGHNRADYSFIPGGMTPGVIVIKPDFPEVKTDWPFLWFENEYTVSTTSAYILAANAAAAAAKEAK
ncbi:glycoside hydrolase family 9 protein [Sphingomonas sp. NFR15]|uniref:glycoside hydrolase family 9 protein n=1 Tax=Sphingomonas sp. NFR15 TaxID=1566282 RepID=UPI000887594E|nr:glycoside hydrolase family 9 protein [Sphingomonas sp. NFR15]SDA31129.1 N-terminal ig-like domain of cellulase [Sphingomonas sp. NFR15]